jgi:hypothetical protein
MPSERLDMPEIGLIVADPGHFHAALVQKTMYPGLSPKVHVYALFGPDPADYLTRIARFNTRKEQPTHWQLEVHGGPDFLERMCLERPGTVAIFSGRNHGKVQRILSAVEAGINVLADKPLIIDSNDLPLVEKTLNAADERGLVVYDMSSEGRQATIATLMRLLRDDPEVFGDPVPGTRTDPGVTTASVHHIMKEVAGVPNLRPRGSSTSRSRASRWPMSARISSTGSTRHYFPNTRLITALTSVFMRRSGGRQSSAPHNSAT